MLRIAICDDMSEFLLSVKRQLEQWKGKPDSMVIELFADGDSLMESHLARPFDIILLDIIMPLFNGIDTAAEIRKHDRTVKIVFLTSSSEYAVDSYKVHADNYLLKPVVPERLYRCLDELYADITDRAKCISVNSNNAVRRIEIRSIEYIESRGKKEILHLTGGSTVESGNPHYFFEDKLLLEDGFFKCHRSYIVNIYHIDTYTHKEIKMKSGAHIPISRSCHTAFETAFFNLLFS